MKQPPGLYLLAMTELWERFGFYSMQTIAVLYMTKGLHFSDHHAYMIYATFGSILYLTPVAGGYVADHYIGFQRAIMIGGSLLGIGYLTVAVPDAHIFFLGMGILVVANGLFKPNVSSIVGELYNKNDPRRDGGFTIFYMGINIGSLIPPLFIGWMVKTYGWHSGFILSACGMVISLITFHYAKSKLGLRGALPKHSLLQRIKKLSSGEFYTIFYFMIVVLALLSFGLFYIPELTNLVLLIGSIIIISLLTIIIFRQPKSDRYRMLAAIMLIIISIGFWALYNQTFTSLMLFADRNMRPMMLGIPISAETTQFFNPLFIILLSPILSYLWISLDKKQLNPSIPTKFALGVLFMSLGFIFLSCMVKTDAKNGITSPWWLFISYGLQTVGELLISPIGLSMITVLSPKRFVGMMMGIWFLSQAVSFALGGFLANIADVPKKLSAVLSLPIYSHAFLQYGIIAALFTLVSFALIPLIKNFMQQ